MSGMVKKTTFCLDLKPLHFIISDFRKSVKELHKGQRNSRGRRGRKGWI